MRDADRAVEGPAGAGGEQARRIRAEGLEDVRTGRTGALRPEHQRGRGRFADRTAKALGGGGGPEHPDRDAIGAQRGGQRGQRERVVLGFDAGQQDQGGAGQNRRSRRPVQGTEHGPGQGVLDVDTVGVVLLVGVNQDQGRAADRLPRFDHAPAGQHAVQHDAAPFGVRGPGRGDQIGQVPLGRHRLPFAGLHGLGGLGGEHAQVDQVLHPLQPGDVRFRVAAVTPGLAAVRPEAVPAVPGAQRRFGDAQVPRDLPRRPGWLR